MKKFFTFLAFLLLVSLSILLGGIIFIFGRILVIMLFHGKCESTYQSCLQGDDVQTIQLILILIYAVLLTIFYLFVVKPIIIKVLIKTKNFIVHNFQLIDFDGKVVDRILWGLIFLNIGVGMFLARLLSSFAQRP